MTTMEQRLAELEAVVADQQRLLESQRTELVGLRERHDQPRHRVPAGNDHELTRATAGEMPDPTGSDDGGGRRSLFKIAATAAAAAATAPIWATTAHADNGDPVLLGATNTATNDTVINGTGSGIFTNENILTVTDDLASSGYPAAVGAYAQGDRVYNGLYAYADDRSATDVNSGHPVVARRGSFGRSNIYMPASGGDPRSDGYAHARGELRSSGGTIWCCVTSGTPGVWRKLAGPQTAGAIHAIAPRRVYDSRLAEGALAAGSNRIVSVTDAIDPITGAVVLANLVPSGATAVMFNITLAATVDAGFLGVTPGDTATVQASTINWSTSGLSLANASVSTLDTARQLKVFCGGIGSTQFIVDVTAYMA